MINVVAHILYAFTDVCMTQRVQHSLCRIDDGVSDAITKVNGDGSENFKHFFVFSLSFLRDEQG